MPRLYFQFQPVWMGISNKVSPADQPEEISLEAMMVAVTSFQEQLKHPTENNNDVDDNCSMTTINETIEYKIDNLEKKVDDVIDQMRQLTVRFDKLEAHFSNELKKFANPDTIHAALDDGDFMLEDKWRVLGSWMVTAFPRDLAKAYSELHRDTSTSRFRWASFFLHMCAHTKPPFVC